MTDKAVELSITQKLYGEVIEYQREIAISELETGISQVVQELGVTVLMAGLKGLDDELRIEVPAGWHPRHSTDARWIADQASLPP